jgi:hypothetical protein
MTKGLQRPLNKSYISYFLFIVSIEFAVSIHCNRYHPCMCFPSVVFFPSPYLFAVAFIMSSLYIFHQLCFSFAVFVHCSHYLDLVDESDFSEEIYHVHCLLLVIMNSVVMLFFFRFFRPVLLANFSTSPIYSSLTSPPYRYCPSPGSALLLLQVCSYVISAPKLRNSRAFEWCGSTVH